MVVTFIPYSERSCGGQVTLEHCHFSTDGAESAHTISDGAPATVLVVLRMVLLLLPSHPQGERRYLRHPGREGRAATMIDV